MTRQVSVGSVNGRTRIHGSEPGKGTKIRKVWDLLHDHAGKAVELTNYAHDGSMLVVLRDIYGLDIRRVGKCRYALVGEWFGRVYIDYTQQDKG
jgi:hypothetical protein